MTVPLPLADELCASFSRAWIERLRALYDEGSKLSIQYTACAYGLMKVRR